MEFALEGYGLVPAKLLRAEVKRRLSGDPLIAIKMQRMERFADMISSQWSPRTSSHERHLRYLLRLLLSHVGAGSQVDADDAAEIEMPLELLSTLRGLASSGSVPDVVLRTAIATKSAFDRLRGRGLDLRLTDCSLEQGRDLYLGVYSPTVVADIAVNDAVAAGAMVALRGDPEGGMKLEVLCRIYRKVCQNGMVVFAGERAAQGIDVDRLAEEPAALLNTLERELVAQLDGSVFQAAVEGFRQSDAEPLPNAALHEELAAFLRARMDPERVDAVMQRYRAEWRFTRWGLANAITAEARDMPRGAALDLERVGAMVAGVSAFGVARAPARKGSPEREVRTKRERIAS